MAYTADTSFLMSTGNLTEVVYGHNRSKGQFFDVYLLCTYFAANTTNYFKPPVWKKAGNKKWRTNSDGSKSNTKFVTNKQEKKQHSSKSIVSKKTERKIWSKNNDDSKSGTKFGYKNPDYKQKQHYNNGPKRINAIFRDIGLVYKNDKMYSMEVSKIHNHIRNFSRFGPNKSYYSPKSFQNRYKKNTSNSYDHAYNTQKIHRELNTNTSSSEMSCIKNVNENQNYYQQQPIIQKALRYTDAGISHDYSNQNQEISMKYWSIRHLLFSKFNNGILLDDESFYSVCPEVLSEHIANRCADYVVLDPFCGAGGNIIQLAMACEKVIAIDIDPAKIELAKHNAKIYGVAHKIQFIVGDFFALAPTLRADVVFMSPPWGGPEYSCKESYSLASMCDNYYGGGFGIFELVKQIAPRIAFHLPRNTNIYECLWLAKDFGLIEVQQNIIDHKLNSLTVFFGDFIEIQTSDYQKYR